MLEISLKGQVGIVTGAGSAYEIERSIVLAAASAGAAAVYACDINLGAFDALKDAIKAVCTSCEVEGRQLNVSSEGQAVALLSRMLKKHGGLDFFFANAGYAVYR